MPEKQSIAVLGLGIMGSGMADRLIQHGHPVTVYNRSFDKTNPLVKRGAKAARTAREAVSDRSIVISMVADDAAARATWLGENGALAGVKPGTVLIESSTISPDWISELAGEAQPKNCPLLDAPVSGSKPQVAAGELIYLVGGDEAVLNQVRPVLQTMSKAIHHLGPNGSGARMKLINNFMCAVQTVALAETFGTIGKYGMNAEAAMAVLTNGAPGSPFIKAAAARMLARNYEPNFMLKWMEKDLRYADKQAGGMEICQAAIHVLQRAMDAGYGDKDFSAMVELFRGQA